MKTIRILNAPIFKVLFLLIFTICFSSCGKKNQQTNSFKKEAFNKSKNEEIETSFFIEMGNAMNSIISKSQVAQQKSSESKIVEVSKKITDHQIQLLQQVNEMANKKLIIITDINAAHQDELTALNNKSDSVFNKAYLGSMETALDQQIKLLEQISKRTNDQLILKLALQYLPEQYQLLRETEQIKSEFN